MRNFIQEPWLPGLPVSHGMTRLKSVPIKIAMVGGIRLRKRTLMGFLSVPDCALKLQAVLLGSVCVTWQPHGDCCPFSDPSSQGTDRLHCFLCPEQSQLLGGREQRQLARGHFYACSSLPWYPTQNLCLGL